MASKTPSDKAANVSETARDVVSDANSRASQAVSAASQRVRQVFQGSRTLDECERIMTAPGSLHEMRWELGQSPVFDRGNNSVITDTLSSPHSGREVAKSLRQRPANHQSRVSGGY